MRIYIYIHTYIFVYHVCDGRLYNRLTGRVAVAYYDNGHSVAREIAAGSRRCLGRRGRLICVHSETYRLSSCRKHGVCDPGDATKFCRNGAD